LQSLDGRSVRYHDAWAIAGDGPGYTWTSDNPAARGEIAPLIGQPEYCVRIDYIFVGSLEAHPDARCQVRSANQAFDQPIDGVWPSDHFGVVAELDIGLER
jgi:hypothetical protein